MNPSTITIEATLMPDGQTLQLEKKLPLPPGRVTVTLQTAGSPSGPTMLEVLDRIHHEQRKRVHVPMTEEQMNAEIAQRRAETEEEEERWREIWSQTNAPDKRMDAP